MVCPRMCVALALVAVLVLVRSRRLARRASATGEPASVAISESDPVGVIGAALDGTLEPARIGRPISSKHLGSFPARANRRVA
jgi:hypothetical protein